MFKRSEKKESVEDLLLDMLANLGKKELKRFHHYLQNGPGGHFTTIKKSLEKASRRETVALMVETYTKDHVMEVARLILEKINKGQSEEKDIKTLHTIHRIVMVYFINVMFIFFVCLFICSFPHK